MFKTASFVFTYLSIIVLLLLTLLNIKNYLQPQKVLGTEINIEETLQQKNFWEEFLTKSPTYYEGWIELSEINQKLGNENEARENFVRALEIKPNLLP